MNRLPVLVGERINGSGSRLVRRLLLAGDYDGILCVAREQLAAGAQALDVCAAIPGEAGEAERLCALVDVLARETSVPLLIDSADPDVLIAGLSAAGGRPAIVNSVNMIDRRGLDRILPVALECGATVIAQTVDEHGVAETSEEKLRLALRLVQVLTEDYGMALESIWVDPVLLPLVRLPNAAIETLAALRQIKAELPGVGTVVGLSNLSYGMAAPLRSVLSSAFLHHASQVGLGVAIADPARLVPCERLTREQRQTAETARRIKA